MNRHTPFTAVLRVAKKQSTLPINTLNTTNKKFWIKYNTAVNRSIIFIFGKQKIGSSDLS